MRFHIPFARRRFAKWSGLVALSIATTIVNAAPGDTDLISKGQLALDSDQQSSRPSVSADGRFVVYQSDFSDLVGGDTNGRTDVFLYDGAAQTTGVMSHGSNLGAADADSTNASISGDGRFVVFTSMADNLVPDDTNGQPDVFVRDLAAQTIERVSIGLGGQASGSTVSAAAISSNGRYVVFSSTAANLVAGDTNARGDIFVRDRVNGTTQRVSLGSGGIQANGSSSMASISGDGRYVAFLSEASNLVAGDTNALRDLFVRDLQSGTTERVNVGVGGVQANNVAYDAYISANGRFVTFVSFASNLVSGDTNGLQDIFVRDRQLGVTTRANLSNAGAQAIDAPGCFPGVSGSYSPAISGDGRYVSFYACSSSVEADSVDIQWDTFLRDRVLGTTTRLGLPGKPPTETVALAGISADGRYLAIQDHAAIYLKDQIAGTGQLIHHAGNSYSAGGTIAASNVVSADGRYVAFVSAAHLAPGDPDSQYLDVFVRDTQSGTTERASIGDAGIALELDSYQPAISANGRFVSFTANFTDPTPGDGRSNTEVFVRDRESDHTERVNVSSSGAIGNGEARESMLSADGRFVAFVSRASNLVTGDSNDEFDVFVRDRQLGQTERISVSSTGVQANGASGRPVISADGRYVAFESSASNLVAGDTNVVLDVFVRDRVTGKTTRVNLTSTGAQAENYSGAPSISADGRYVAFETAAENFFTNYQGDSGQWIFLRDTIANTTELVSVGRTGGIDASAANPAISANGRYVAFRGSSEFLVDVCDCIAAIFVRDREARSTATVSIGKQGGLARASSYWPSISADGRHVAFQSYATNLTPDDTDGDIDVFVHELDASPATVIRINAGGGAFTDSAGRLWSADAGFNTGSVSTSSAPVANTVDDGLYQSIRWDDAPAPELQYSIPVPNGSYEVRLYFMESNTGTAKVGGRVFSVDMEGAQQFNVDVFAEAGLNAALLKSATVNVADGQLNIQFKHKVKNPIISAIEIVSLSTGPDVRFKIRTNVGGGEYVDSKGQIWAADNGFDTGSTSTSTAPIAGTVDDTLYQSIRWDDTPEPELTYNFYVESGTYDVILHFAESNPKTAFRGARVFDIYVQGSLAFDNFDVFARAGDALNTAVVATTTAFVVSGGITISLHHQVKNPILSAIEIVRK